MKILVIEDNGEINYMICEFLTQNGFECVSAFTGSEALYHLNNLDNQFSLALLDLMLPGNIEGKDILLQIKEKLNIPVIVVSALDAIDTKVNLLSCGADDYVCKPFELDELLARINVQLRKQTYNDVNSYKFKDIVMNLKEYRVYVDGNEVKFTKHEFKILELLMSNPDKVYTKSEIYSYAWGQDFCGDEKTVNTHVSNIRQKLRDLGNKDYIKTIWGIGFKMLAD